MISTTDINAACDLSLAAMAQYASGRKEVPAGFNWWNIDAPICSDYWRNVIWSIIHDAIGEPIEGAMPHAVYAMIAPELSTVSGCDQGGTETDADFFKRALIAIAYPPE